MVQDIQSNHERTEKVRQEIMRFRELLTIMRERLNRAERRYADLFAGLPTNEVAGLKEKDLQWKAAESLLADDSALGKAVLQARFDARELERAFEELYDIIVTVSPSDRE